MAKKTFKAEEIINKLREVEVLTSQGKSVSVICKALAISDQTYYYFMKYPKTDNICVASSISYIRGSG